MKRTRRGVWRAGKKKEVERRRWEPQAEMGEGPREGQRERHGEAERLKPVEAQSKQRDPQPDSWPVSLRLWEVVGARPARPKLGTPQTPSTPACVLEIHGHCLRPSLGPELQESQSRPCPRSP